jgi:hypothetical protein
MGDRDVRDLCNGAGITEVAGRFRQVAGRFREVAGRFREVAGRFREVAGTFREVAGRFREVAGRFREVAGTFREVAGRFRKGGSGASLDAKAKDIIEVLYLDPRKPSSVWGRARPKTIRLRP